MTNIWGGGGLGDAAMMVAKLYSKNSPVKKKDVLLTHTMRPLKLLPAINAFYLYHEINHLVVPVTTDADIENYTNIADYQIGPGWRAESEGDPISWETDPFVDSIVNVKNNDKGLTDIDIIISPYAGRNSTRRFSVNSIKNFINKHNKEYKIGLVGTCEPGDLPAFNIENCFNYMNTTSIPQAMSLIHNAKIIIGHPGFIVYVAGLSRKKIYSTKEPNWEKRYHPDWYVDFITDLDEIKL